MVHNFVRHPYVETRDAAEKTVLIVACASVYPRWARGGPDRPAGWEEGRSNETKPYEFIGFGALDVTKPYEFIRFGAIDVTKPYECSGK